MSQDFYERFSESNKIRLLCEKDQEIYNLEKELEELKEQNKSLLALKLELEKLKNINSLKRDKIVKREVEAGSEGFGDCRSVRYDYDYDAPQNYNFDKRRVFLMGSGKAYIPLQDIRLFIKNDLIVIELDDSSKTAIFYSCDENGENLSNDGVLTEVSENVFNAIVLAFTVDPRDYGVSLIRDKDVKIDLEVTDDSKIS